MFKVSHGEGVAVVTVCHLVYVDYVGDETSLLVPDWITHKRLHVSITRRNVSTLLHPMWSERCSPWLPSSVF